MRRADRLLQVEPRVLLDCDPYRGDLGEVERSLIACTQDVEHEQLVGRVLEGDAVRYRLGFDDHRPDAVAGQAKAQYESRNTMHARSPEYVPRDRRAQSSRKAWCVGRDEGLTRLTRSERVLSPPRRGNLRVRRVRPLWPGIP